MSIQLKDPRASRPVAHTFLKSGGLLFSVACLAMALYMAHATPEASAQKRLKGNPSGIVFLDEYKTPGLEMELSGIQPHPTDDNLYYVAANKRPAYRAGQKPLLPVQYRGKLLTVNRRTGEIVRAFDLSDGEYGGIAYGHGFLYVSSLEPSEILKVDPQNGQIRQRIPLSGPAGGLAYDKERNLLIAQLFISFPHLAVVDPKTGATIETLWSDESAMDIAKVKGDWLCTWTSGFDKQAFSELRLLDQKTGKVKGRVPLEGIHTSMAALDKNVAGVDGFISLVALDRTSGKAAIRRFSYQKDRMVW